MHINIMEVLQNDTKNANSFLVDDQDTIKKIRKIAPSDRSIIGSNEYIIDQIGQLIGLGFDEIIFPDFTLGKDSQSRLDSYEKIRLEILSHFQITNHEIC